ncbi:MULTISPECIES: hypothetical protein [unclassified Novosphingobium]|uniref:hypothetical protein n=1 Tax=unclassified Novosphingobium TaxID=2644732 RepID=UPI000EBB3CE2|nr:MULTISPECIES: hypothetical protein [unclassified Novosphingobium]HCF24069.1 hypothetical protein [Novosphingobium sp.]HQV04417.1 hypothetical protein [Novosphingobium sp.]
MSEWKMASAPYSDGARDLTMDLNADGVSGTIAGSVVFKGTTFTVSGVWAAAGSEPDRDYTVIGLSGANASSPTRTIALVATVVMGGGSAQGMDVNLVTASSADDTERTWGGAVQAISY